MDFHLPPDTILSGRNILHTSRPGVYAWIREEKYLYIGHSAKVLTRIFLHNVLNSPANPILPDDKIVIWYFKTKEEAAIEEAKLILKFKPIHNIVGRQKRLLEINCLFCGAKFQQRRMWQKFCTMACQQRHEPYGRYGPSHVLQVK